MSENDCYVNMNKANGQSSKRLIFFYLNVCYLIKLFIYNNIPIPLTLHTNYVTNTYTR